MQTSNVPQLYYISEGTVFSNAVKLGKIIRPQNGLYLLNSMEFNFDNCTKIRNSKVDTRKR